MEQISVIAAGVCEQQNMDFDAQMKELCSLAEACGLCVAENLLRNCLRAIRRRISERAVCWN